jgi:coenzyme F420 hydrogenase subunit beta
MKRYAIREEMNSIAEPPGKTWFWELESAVIEAERCIQCGTCVAVCPSNSLGVNVDTGLPELVKMCTGCSLCWDFCPRAGLRYEATWPPATTLDDSEPSPEELVERPDPADSYWTIKGVDPAHGLGRVLDRYAVRAARRPDGVQDGGAVTALLAGLLRAGAIDGALVSKPSSDPDETWKGVATIATTVDELYAATGSFYNQTMALAELDLSRYQLPAQPKIAVVGTPCEVEGLRAMQMRRWPTGNHRVDAVVLTVALLCTKSFDYDKLIRDELARKRGVDLERVAKVDVIRGRLIVTYLDGATAIDEPIKEFHGAALKGCDECGDFLGRAADLSVGSVGSADGWTSLLVRTERGREAVERARGSLDLRELDTPEALIALDQKDQRLARKALQRALDTDGGLFMSFDEHLASYAGSDRAPVAIRRPTRRPSTMAEHA